MTLLLDTRGYHTRHKTPKGGAALTVLKRAMEAMTDSQLAAMEAEDYPERAAARAGGCFDHDLDDDYNFNTNLSHHEETAYY